ncbi:hypothetical protein [Halovivax cerinus]|uniref:Uncharacterized protein n=1 Tax=Halovivax cerinus TaxID=1487865 RepID=A0ABD5NSK7_9EURY|nr:hypothetical protein [Halovivax cerinus]
MDRQDFVTYAVVAIGLVVLSFFVRGFGGFVIGSDAADLARAPFLFAGFGLVVYLFVRATLDWLGLWRIDPVDGSE